MVNVQLVVFFCILGLIQVQFSLSHWTSKDFLVPHNEARREVHVPRVVWNRTVEAFAKYYAKVRSQDCELIHSDGPYGENIYWGYGEGYEEPASAVKMWVDEKEDYDYYTNSCAEGKMCGHYTQVVWHDTTSIGCAVERCLSRDAVFITCNYYPPGNYIGKRPYLKD